ncbi:hypothetical protein [Amycolatopsis sp.]|uniref:hypothetical protein n=1 Tax=Amycolatopsis sp. TaxID=37632 RepID=UPI002DFC3C2B|nr:hypothetical protein [Amycolatopsis sp.]
MATLSWFRRVSTTLIVAGVIAGGLAVLQATPAAAESVNTFPSTSSAHTDLLSPFKSFANSGGDTPVGAWFDAQRGYHVTKSYFTFDLKPFQGAKITSAASWVPETSVADCTKPRSTELWVTDPAERPTWLKQPAEKVKLPGPFAPEGGCTWERVTWDTAAAVTDALAAGKTSLTVAMRLPDAKQLDPAFGRRVASTLQMTMFYNRAPNTPTGLGIDNRPCGSDTLFLHPGSQIVYGNVSDPDLDAVGGKFAAWDIADPSQRVDITTTVSRAGYANTSLPQGFLVDGHTYDLTMQAIDDRGLVSPGAATCRLTADKTAPDKPPTVSSTDYPVEGGTGEPGKPGQFTFTSNGVADVASFRYVLTGGGTNDITADVLGGKAVATITPTTAGGVYLQVWSVDRAGNRSAEAPYIFDVKDNSPLLSHTPENGGLGEPREYTFTPRTANVTAYAYTFNDDAEITVPARPDGTATATITPNRATGNTLKVRSRNADGQFSSVAQENLRLPSSAPVVTSDVYGTSGPSGGPGVPGTFTFTTTMATVTEYLYSIDFSGEWVVVPAGPDRKGTVVITPERAGTIFLEVIARNADGVETQSTYYDFEVAP